VELGNGLRLLQSRATILQQHEARGSETNMKDQERDILRKTTLELVKKRHVHYTDIEKKAVATCLASQHQTRVRKQFYHYPLANGYVERVSRGIYKITQKGEKLLEILM
jgi:hypothetical protein